MVSLETILVPPVPPTRVDQVAILGRRANTATAVAAHR